MKHRYVKCFGLSILISPWVMGFGFLFSDSGYNPIWGHQSSVEVLLSKMTVEEKIGQLLMVGIDGKKMLPHTRHLIQDLKVGGIILYTHNVENPKQVRELVYGLQSMDIRPLQIPLFISVDQEGGSVARIRKNLQVFPAPMALGATYSSQFSFLTGKVTGQDLSAMGINMNLAPVLDINTQGDNHVIGVRSFGDSPELVSQMGMWYIEGLQSQGVVATAKHFPGHGNTIKDSHYVLPVLTKELHQIENFQLVPFQKAIDNGLDAIMTAHISVSSLDPSGLPATLSYNLLTNLMRKKMNFKGIIITDDLEMKSIRRSYGVGEATLKAILAGADMVMIGWTDEKKSEAYQSLMKAYREGKLSDERLNQSVKRILSLKIKRGIFDSVRKLASQSTLKYLKHPIHQKLAREIATHAITVVKNQHHLFPLQEEDGRRILLVTHLRKFYDELHFFHEQIRPYFIPLRPTISEMDRAIVAIQKTAKREDLFIFGFTHHSQLELIHKITQKVDTPLIVVSFGSPYYLKKLPPGVSTFICSYGTQPELIRATAEVLAGIVQPKGKLPVSMKSENVSFGLPSGLSKHGRDLQSIFSK